MLRVRSLLILFALLLALPIGAQEADRATVARTHLRVGLELYSQGRFDEAITEFRAGQAADPQPDFLYALGQSERRRGNCRAALVHYRAFVKVAHALEQVGAATKVMEACEKEVAAEDDRLAVQQRIAAAAAMPPPRPWYRDPLGDTLVFAGAAAVIAGAGLFGASQAKWARADDNYGDYVDARNATALHTAGIACLVVGGAAVLGGAIRWGVEARKRHR